MTFHNLLVSKDGPVAIVTINRPQVLNALDSATIDELRRAMLDIRHDTQVRVAVITGAGEKAFAAGADIKELASASPTTLHETALHGQHVFDLIENLGKPVIAAVNGFALGGGCELALACTFRVAADTARLGQPEINLGLIPGYGGSQRLARLVGRDHAMELVLTGRQVRADEARQMGLVTRVVAAADLLSEVRAFADTLASKSSVTVRLAMEAVNRGLDMSLAEGCRHEAALFGLAAATDDMREGTRAFLEKRSPEFKGR
jgi:enoyl-CoA hydratase